MAPTNTTPAVNGRARRRRLRRQRIREELRKCRGNDVSDGISPVASSMAFGPEDRVSMPGLPITGGMTSAGEAWALKAVHPCGEEATGVLGIPDHVSVPVVTPEFRTNFIIPSIGTAATATDDVDLLVLPFADLPVIYRRYKSGSQPDINTKWDAIWNATLTTSAQLVSDAIVDNSSPTKTPVGFTTPVRSSNLDSVYGYGRVTHKGVTIHLDAPALSDQGRIIAGQMALPFNAEHALLTARGWRENQGGIVGVEGIGDYYSLDNVPLEENCLVQASPGAVAWEARQGVYVPLRFRDPVHNFSPSGSAAILAATRAGGKTHALMLNESMVGPTGTTGGAYVNIAPKMLLNCQTAVVLIRGISPSANIHAKVITGLESLVETCSSVSPYQRISPVLDVEAINWVTRMGQELPQGFPASYNDFGFLNKIINGINLIAKPIRNKVLRKIPGIGKYFDWQEENIYKPMGLAGPQRMPTMTGWNDPLRRVYDRMIGNRGGYGGLYA